MKLLLLLFMITITACEGKDPCIVDVICKVPESEECKKFHEEVNKKYCER